MTAADHTKVKLFGELTLAGGERPVFETQRSAKILALLLLSPGGRMHRARLGALLWPDDFEDANRLRLRQELSRLRRTLGEREDILSADKEFVSLDLGRVDCDLHQLQRSSKWPDDKPDLTQRLQEVLADCQLELLSSWSDPWVFGERSAAHELRSRTALRLAGRLLDEGAFEGAAETASLVIEHDPLNEEARVIRVKATSAMGHLTHAMADFQEYKALVRERSGVNVELDPTALIAPSPQARAHAPASQPSSKLPAPIDAFFGRQSELHAIAAKFAEGQRLLTLLGPGGIGKTRLTIEFGRSCGETFRSVNFATFEGAASSKPFASEILEQLDILAPDLEAALHYLASSLGPEGLLIIDNANDLTSENRADLERLLKQNGSLRILATSRKPLGIPGESVLHIGPLPGPDALAMLQSHMRRPGGAGMDAALNDLVAELDGMPLALKLAASRLKVLSPSELLTQLSSSPHLLKGAASVPERHKTIEEVLSQSLQALTPEQTAAFETLCALEVPTDVMALEHLLGPSAIDLTEQLLDESLLTVEDGGRRLCFRVLHPIRRVLLGRIAPERVQEVQRAFLALTMDRLRTLVPSSTGPLSMEVIHALDLESPNFELLVRPGEPWRVEALERLGPYLLLRSRPNELLKRLEPYEQLGTELRALKARALCGISRDEEGVALLQEVIAEHMANGDLDAAYFLDGVRRGAQRRLGGLQQQLEEIEPTWSAVSANGSLLAQARHAYANGGLLIFARRPKEASEWYERAYRLALESGDASMTIVSAEIWTSIRLGPNFIEETGIRPTAELQAVRSQLQEWIAELGHVSFQAAHHEQTARLSFGVGSYAKAESEFRAALALWDMLGNQYQCADQNHSLAKTLLAMGRAEEAKPHLAAALDGWLVDNDFGGAMATLGLNARRLHLEGKTELAKECLATTKAALAAYDWSLVSEELALQAELEAELGDLPTPTGDLDPHSYYRFLDA